MTGTPGSLGPFRLGDLPADPLEIRVIRPGDTAPLSGITAADIEMMTPDAQLQTWGATIDGTTVRAMFPVAFSQLGQYRVRARLTGAGGVVERTAWAPFWVRPV